MIDTMTIRRSCEQGMYLLREGECFWRVNKDGEIDCATQGPTRLSELLHFLQEWKPPSRRLFLNDPLKDPSNYMLRVLRPLPSS